MEVKAYFDPLKHRHGESALKTCCLSYRLQEQEIQRVDGRWQN